MKSNRPFFAEDFRSTQAVGNVIVVLKKIYFNVIYNSIKLVILIKITLYQAFGSGRFSFLHPVCRVARSNYFCS